MNLNIFDKRQMLICIDTVMNPARGLLGGPDAEEAERILRVKFRFTNNAISKLKDY
jgi:hypothetical protein